MEKESKRRLELRDYCNRMDAYLRAFEETGQGDDFRKGQRKVLDEVREICERRNRY